MRRLGRMLTEPLRRMPVEAGEKYAWWLLLAVAGFGAGWAAAVAYWSSWCYPIS